MIRYHGTIGNPAQTWSFGLRVPTPTLSSQANLDDLALALTNGSCRAHAAIMLNNCGGNLTTIDGVSIYQYATLPGPAVAQSGHNFAPQIVGQADNMPSEVALVVTLLSGRPGSSNRGRIYLPMTKVSSLEQSGQVSQASLTALGDAVTDVLADVNNSLANLGFANDVSIVSVTKGTAVKVTSILIDSKADAQRRREDKIGAAYRVTKIIA